MVLVGCEGAIQRSHLPDDFLEEQELQAAVQTAAPLTENAPPAVVVAGASDGQRLQDVALVAMTKMLQQHKGNVSAAAKALGVSRNTVYRRKEQLPPDVWN